jgi:hypothetical protein
VPSASERVTQPLAGEANARPAIATEPGHAAIAELAFSYWLAREDAEGSAEEDWLRAERELRIRRAEGSGDGKPDGPTTM